jgi:hypothetical protein
VEKQCGRCGETKPIEEFHRRSRGDGRQPWCKTCRRAYDSAYSTRTSSRRRARRAERKREFALWYEALKEERPCTDCGGRFPAAAMQWDHLPGTEKLADVANLLRRMCKRRVLEEIAKCELVCANCHAIRTVNRRSSRGVAQPG